MIHWGIIGCGNVTELKSGPAFNKVENSKLVAVMRRNAEKAQDYAERHQVPFWYHDADALIERADINAIYIATPPSSHFEYAVKALKAGKFVYLEKPMTLDVIEAEKLAKLVKETNGKLVVAHYRRQLPMFLKVKSLLESNAIGNVKAVELRLIQSRDSNRIAHTEVNWRLQKEISGGGYFHDLAPHQLDLIYYFFGKKFLNYSGVNLTKINAQEMDEKVSGNIVLNDGIVFNGLWVFNASEVSNKDEVIIYGDEGEIRFPIFGNEVILKEDSTKGTFTFEHPTNIQHPMIDATVTYFLGNGENPCSVEEGLEVMKVIDAFTK